MFKKIISTLILASLLISMFFPQTALADSSDSQETDFTGVTVRLEKVNSWLGDWFGKHGYEDWFKDDKSCNDYNHSISNIQFIKVKIQNNSGADIVLDRNNQLVLQFSNSTGKELGLKLYDFVAYQNIDKATRNYTFGSKWFSYRKIKHGSSLEIYGYVKWMNFSDLKCTVVNQVKESNVKVRLTENSVNKDNPTDRIHSVLKLYNEGTSAIDLNKIRIHYYFNMDGDLDKVAPKAEKVEGKVYNYQSDRSNPYEYVISTLPSAFINMDKYSGDDANCYIEMGFPTSDNSSDYYGNFLYKFLRYYNDEDWCNRYFKLDNDWYDDILDYSVNYSWGGCDSKDNKKHRWWWNWSSDYTKSNQNYTLNSKSSKGTSYVTVDLEIIKKILDGVTGNTADLRKFYQTNHYSYNPGSEIDWEKVTVYYEGELIWGNEPSATLVAPTNLQAIAKKDGILLQWDEVVGAESYRILRKGADDTDFVEFLDVVSENNFLDANVTADITYNYKVKAVSDNGEKQGPLSNEASAKALNLSGNGLYAEYLNWANIANSSLTNYDYDESNSFKTDYVLTNTDLALARVDPKVDFTKNNADSYYKWGTIAPDEKVNADYYSVIWSGYVKPKYSENYTFYTNTDDGVKLWIDIDRDGSFEDGERLINNWTKHSETQNNTKVISLQKDLKYKIKMEYFENQVDATAQLLWKSTTQNKEIIPTTQLFVDDAVLRPETPTNLVAVVQGDTTVQLTWNSVLDATGYKIYETDKNGTTREIIVSNNFCSIPALPAGEYTYKVSAYNDAGESEKSVPAMVKIGLDAPSNLTAAVMGKSVTLSWDAVNEATGYKIYRLNDGVIETATSSTTGYTDNDVSWGEIYSYSVVALKNNSEGIRSNEVPAIISASAPRNLTSTLDGMAVTLDWLAGEGAQSYNVLRSDDLKVTFNTIASEVTDITYIDNSVPITSDENGKRYYYKVVAVSNGVESQSSNIAGVIIYPYVDTDMGLLRYNIINNSKSSKIDFVLGSYVPVSMELKLSDTTVNPKFIVEDLLTSDAVYGEVGEPFTASVITNIGLKAYVNSSVCSEIDTSKANEIKFNGSYAKDFVIKMEFVMKISATEEALNTGIEDYYNKLYKLNFGISADKQGNSQNSVYISADKSKNPLALHIKVLKPNKLN